MAKKYGELHGKIISKFGSIKAFSEVLGKSYPTISKKLDGDTDFKLDEVREWSEILELSSEESRAYFLLINL